MTQDEIELWRRYRPGDKAARNELVLHYAWMVEYWAKQIALDAPWAQIDDLIQDGTIGLMTAVEKFDLERGLEFSTFARYHIFGKMYKSRELTRNLSQRQKKRKSQITKKHDELALKLGSQPTHEEIANELGLSISQVAAAITAEAFAFAAGIDEPDSDVPRSTQRPGSGFVTMPDQETKVVVHDALSRMKEREELILTASIWNGESDAEIARRIGMTESGVRSARQRAEKKLCKLLGIKTGSAGK